MNRSAIRVYSTALIACWIFSVAACARAADKIDVSPMPLRVTGAFKQLAWTGWEVAPENGINVPLRPIVLTHAGDGSNRVFVATQHGVVHVFPNKPDVKQTKIFFDLSGKVVYNDKENEEGLLGLAFHPRYKQNGQFFIYYTTKSAPHTSVISRFRVSADDPDQADAAFEEEILRIPQPYWNHNGGTLVFGPDGFLYIGLGDGGAANDPHGNGQNRKTLLGSILRIDVDRKDKDLGYAIPADNPFAQATDGSRGEIYAYGVRNIWRMAFDRETGTLWAGDVGQDLWEEIDIIQKGGNYGWNRREAGHPFGPKGSPPRRELIEPIWEYPHSLGKSITGGLVYRGQKLPELQGMYLYADYVSGLLWALKYDEASKKVTANRTIPADKFAVISYGEDKQGEVYFLIVSAKGEGIFTFEKNRKKAR